jgi:hypothetical protein
VDNIVDDHEHEFIFRVSLPVYPWYKTEAEVATIVLSDLVDTPKNLQGTPAPQKLATSPLFCTWH